MAVSAIVLELSHNVHARVLRHCIADQSVYCVVGFCLGGTVRTNDSCEIDVVVVVELGRAPKWLPGGRFAVAIVVIGVGGIIGVTRAAAARISDVILVANGVVVKPGALAGDG